MRLPPDDTPVACDMTAATDTPDERLAEYAQLFTGLVGRERTDRGVLFRLRADPGTEEHVRDLAARELACCPFFAFDISTVGDEVHWEAAVIDNDAAREVLDEFYVMPEKLTAGPAVLRAEYEAKGLRFDGEPITH
jgi:hypothetical protein